MRKKEHGKSMPSGDSASCAFMMTWILILFNQKWGLIFVLPMTMAGRVYVHCHWICDTIVGSIIGIASGIFFYRLMPILGLPLFNMIMQA